MKVYVKGEPFLSREGVESILGGTCSPDVYENYLTGRVICRGCYDFCSKLSDEVIDEEAWFAREGYKNLTPIGVFI